MKEQWICPNCEEPGEMSYDDCDAPCIECAAGAGDALLDQMKDQEMEDYNK